MLFPYFVAVGWAVLALGLAVAARRHQYLMLAGVAGAIAALLFVPYCGLLYLMGPEL
jgi:hypothetical protein